MSKSYAAIMFLLAGVIFLSVRPAAAQEDLEVIGVIQDHLDEKTLVSGTLDLYDEEKDAVRTLRLMKPATETRSGEGGAMLSDWTFRDTASGDIVKLTIATVEGEGGAKVESLTVASIRPPENAAGTMKTEEATDADLQALIKGYLDEQSKFTGYVSLYDPKAETLRKLELVELMEEVRRLGIFATSSAIFKDLDSGETLKVDISVKNGKVHAMKIREVR